MSAAQIWNPWSLLSEEFDPREAKAKLGRVAAAGTAGGLAGGILAERVVAWFRAESLMLPLSLLHLLIIGPSARSFQGASPTERLGDMDHHDSHISRRDLLLWMGAGSLQLLVPLTTARAAEGQLTRAQKEEFLLKAKIVKTRDAPKGVTGTVRATLDDGTLTHEVSIQVIDEYKTRFDSPQGPELNFKDSWKFNLAAYKLDQLLGLNMVPVTVERTYRSRSGSFTWWVDNVLMDEGERRNKKIEPPDPDNWNSQMHIVRVFDQLIFNIDRNLQNLVVDKNWQIWMIDHSRSFRTLLTLREPKNLERCDGQLIEKLRGLTAETLKKGLGRYLTVPEINGLLARRDRIVKAFEGMGPSAIYTSVRRPD